MTKKKLKRTGREGKSHSVPCAVATTKISVKASVGGVKEGRGVGEGGWTSSRKMVQNKCPCSQFTWLSFQRLLFSKFDNSCYEQRARVHKFRSSKVRQMVSALAHPYTFVEADDGAYINNVWSTNANVILYLRKYKKVERQKKDEENRVSPPKTSHKMALYRTKKKLSQTKWSNAKWKWGLWQIWRWFAISAEWN